MAADLQKAQKAAEELLAKYKICKAPIDPEAIAEAEGVNVVYAKFSETISKEIAGFSDPLNGRIVVNQELRSSRKVYTIAHELGHHILHRDYLDDEGAYQIFPRKNNYIGPKPEVELEADAFADNLLVPLNILRNYADFASASELAEMFMVPRDTLLCRMKRL